MLSRNHLILFFLLSFFLCHSAMAEETLTKMFLLGNVSTDGSAPLQIDDEVQAVLSADFSTTVGSAKLTFSRETLKFSFIFEVEQPESFEGTFMTLLLKNKNDGRRFQLLDDGVPVLFQYSGGYFLPVTKKFFLTN